MASELPSTAIDATAPHYMQPNNGLSKKIVQLVLRNSGYAAWFRTLLLKDGAHHVVHADRPDMRIGGVVVIDEDNFVGLSPILNPERFMVIAHKGTDLIPRIFDSGIRHVVFEEDSLGSAQLAIVGIEMKLAARGNREGSDASSIKRSPN